ncbi:GNAT family N-acetyltransferase [Paenibacillus alkalitolerans]|uniref:GNAT family N-acetyltransferase n=1 Tax=Paenibacillus alkalitolerans TaxID=2799335 RepID=UPI0018F78A14|nr:GNAT family N-acetyltransferase [Paenibacillus alkalitolerans]
MYRIPLRLLAGLLSAGIFPFILLAAVWLIEGNNGAPVPAAWAGILFLYTAPAFLIAGTLFSVVIDSIVNSVGLQRAVLSYGLKLVLYPIAGIISLMFYVTMLTGGSVGTGEEAGGMALLGALASLTYFHVWLALQELANKGGAFEGPAPEPFETERLRLIPCTPEAFQAAREQGYPIGSHIDYYMTELKRDPGLIGWGIWLVQLCDSGKVIGDAGFKGKPDRSKSVELGYGFVPEAWGQGYATETANALVRWAFEQGVSQVTAETERSNAASINVLRKAGFTQYHETDRFFYWQIHIGAKRLQSE